MTLTEERTPGNISVGLGIGAMIIGLLIAWISAEGAGSSWGTYETPAGVSFGSGLVALGVLLIICGYLYRIARAVEALNKKDQE